MTYFIGIDPSINSTGICIQKFNEEEKISEDFIILKPGDKDIPESKWLTKKEKLAEEQFDIRKKKIAMLAEQYKNDPVKIALLNKVAKDLAILENQK